MKRLLLISATVLCVLGSGALGWYFGGHGQISLFAERMRLAAELEAASKELDSLRREVRVLARGIEIERKASSDVREEVTRLQEQIYEHKKEITFYRNIMSPPSGADELQIQSLRIYPTVQSGQFRFKLVMVQVAERRGFVKGSVQLTVLGTREGSPVSLSGDALGPKAGPLDFRFQYYQELEGLLQLPTDFSPSRVSVRAASTGRKSLQAEKAVPWQVQRLATTGGAR